MLWLSLAFSIYTMAIPVLIVFFFVRPYVSEDSDLLIALYGMSALIPFFIVPPIALLILNMLRMLSGTLRKLDKMLKKDPLTNTCTRSAFLTGVMNTKAPKGVFLMIDIDHFKEVNDQWGHDAGDLVLVSVANCLASATNSNMLGRIGGEEFGVYLMDYALDDGYQFAWELCQLVRELDVSYEGKQINITISVGASLHKSGRSIERTMKQADICLYEAKRAGRDRVIKQVNLKPERTEVAA